MVFNPQFYGFRQTSDEAGGNPDYAGAIKRGLELAQTSAKTVNTPRQLSEQYLQSVLANKINGPKAEGAQLAFDTDIGYKQALTNQANRTSKNYLDPITKMQLQTENKAQQVQNALDIKKQQELREHAQKLIDTARDVQGIQDIISTPEGHTGVGANLMNMAGFGNSELGGVNEKALRLQADLTRLISSRGGAGAASIAAQGKPNTWRSTAYNLGLTKSMQDRIKNEYEDTAKEFERVSHGQKLPFSLEDVIKASANKSTSTNQGSKVKYQPAPPGYTLVTNPKTGKPHPVKDEHVPEAIVKGGFVYEQ